MNRRTLMIPPVLLTLLLLGACGVGDYSGQTPVEPRFNHRPNHGGGGGGGGGGGDDGSVTPWSAADADGHGVPGATWTLVSTCPASPGANSTKPYMVWPRHDRCADITLADGTTLTDDPEMVFGMKGSDIVSVQFRQQDVVGPEGIQYESAKVTLSAPVRFTGAGLTVHVHATGVPVYELKGHLSGPRVREAGTMNIGDIIYR